MEKKEINICEEEIIFKEFLIVDKKRLKENRKNIIFLTKNGDFVREVGLNKKCHCNSGKKYKNCCNLFDILGFYDSQINTFFCDIKEFLCKFKNNLEQNIEEEKQPKNEEGSVWSKNIGLY